MNKAVCSDDKSNILNNYLIFLRIKDGEMVTNREVFMLKGMQGRCLLLIYCLLDSNSLVFVCSLSNAYNGDRIINNVPLPARSVLFFVSSRCLRKITRRGRLCFPVLRCLLNSHTLLDFLDLLSIISHSQQQPESATVSSSPSTLQASAPGEIPSHDPIPGNDCPFRSPSPVQQ